jgi:hypothetical protein
LWIGSDYIAEAGYIRRNGFFELSPDLTYLFYPSSGSRIISHGPGVKFDVIFDPAMNMTDRQTDLSYTIGFLDKSQLTLYFLEDFVRLDKPYDPTNTGGIKLQAGNGFSWKTVRTSFVSDIRKLLNYSINASYGGYYNGARFNLSGAVNYRVQPYGSVGFTMNYNDIRLPSPYNSAKLMLVGPSVDITFTDKLFLTTFVQYNNQIDNLNTNVRLQWHFAPVSDLFIVYSGNSYSGDFTNKNRGLIVKLSYWFN